MWNKKIKALADKEENKGILPSIMFPCPVMYLDNDNSGICADCANEDKDGIFDVVDYVLLEDVDIEREYDICDNCGKHIDPALNAVSQETK